MTEWNLVRRTEPALRYLFGGEELADFGVCGGRWAGLIVAEQLPAGNIFEVERAAVFPIDENHIQHGAPFRRMHTRDAVCYHAPFTTRI